MSIAIQHIVDRTHTRQLLTSVTKGVRIVFGLTLSLILLSGCQTSGALNPGTEPAPAPKPSVNTSKAQGEVVGNGPTRIALLVPISAAGNVGVAGLQIANAAKLAMRDFGAGRLQLVIKDTRGQSANAQILANEAITEGAGLVLGPVFSAGVSAASGATLPARTPMIAFSSNQNRARSGIYLLSFPPQADIARTLNYAFSSGANRIVAALPQSSYGNLAATELQNRALEAGAQVVQIVRYGKGAKALSEAADSLASSATSANAIYIPEAGPKEASVPSTILQRLKKRGVQLSQLQVIGSRQWDGIDKSSPLLNGAIFAGPDRQNYARFQSAYEAQFGETPLGIAGSGYDAVSLAAELVRRNPTRPFSTRAIESPSGFSGVGGLFRFRSNGRIQRGLAINRIEGGQVRVVSPAPSGF